MTSFTAQIKNWSDKAKVNVSAVVKQSVQDVFEDAQTPTGKGGRMRVDTGFLRNSLATSLNGSTALVGPDSYTLKVAEMKMGDVLFGGWTAEYAKDREFGARGGEPDYFMRGAAMQWQSIVAANAAQVR